MFDDLHDRAPTAVRIDYRRRKLDGVEQKQIKHEAFSAISVAAVKYAVSIAARRKTRAHIPNMKTERHIGLVIGTE